MTLITPAFSPEARSAYRALQDCKVVRTRFDHPGMFELFEANIADCKVVHGDDENALDWRLT